MQLRFLGASGTVTGSRFLLRWDAGDECATLVDCGLFQGLKELRMRNWAAFSEQPKKIASIILTHAHIDHSGYLPLLVKQGFRGRVYCTRPTRDLLKVLLMDAAHLQEEDAEFANRHGFSKHNPALPLYDRKDVQRALDLLEVVDCGQWHPLKAGARFRLTPSSHILGSVFVEIEARGKRVLFSGDVGRRHPLLFPDRGVVEGADFLVVESTYGSRIHPTTHPSDELERTAREVYRRGGRLIIPCFAVGRAQEVVYLLAQLKQSGRLPAQPVYLDSPMGIAAWEIFRKYPSWHRLGVGEIDSMETLVTPLLSRDESRAAMRSAHPAIVIAGSGMLTGGRVLHHLADRLGDPASMILFTGYQAEGTRGWRLLNQEKSLKLHGRFFEVRAQVASMEGLSAHADRDELLEWVRGFTRTPRETYIVHGSESSARGLEKEIGIQLGWKCRIPTHLEEVEI